MFLILLILFFILFLWFYVFLQKDLKTILDLEMKEEGIPKKIHQTWKSDIVPIKYKDFVKKLKRKNGDFQYCFYNDQKMENFMSFVVPNEWKDFYNNLRYKIQKIDFFRYCLLYYYGGFYADIDYECTRGFEKEVWDTFPKEKIIVPEEYLWTAEMVKKYYPDFSTITDIMVPETMSFVGNYAFLCSKNCRAMYNFIEYLMTKYKKRNEFLSQKFSKDKHVFYTTGPYILTEFAYKYPEQVHVLKRDQKESTFQFGHYGIHHPHHSWNS